MKKKGISGRLLTACMTFVIVCTSLLAGSQPVRVQAAKAWPSGPDPSTLRAESACLMDLKTGQVLYNKNMNRKQYPASITKVMTSLLAVENCSLGETVTFSSDAVYGIEPGSAHIACEVGEELTMEQCLYGMMLASANEVCLAVAEHISGSKEKFADLMNKKAKQLGCKNTHFTNPNGLHDDQHYTSAYDMCLISRAAWQYEEFRKVTGTKYYTMAKTNIKKEERYLLNNHQMLYGWKVPGYEYEYCVGGKTGFTDQSLNTLVTYLKKDDMELVAVVLRSASPLNTSTMNEYTDTKALAEFGFSDFKAYDISKDQAGEDLTKDEELLFTRYSPIFSSDETMIYLGEGSVLLPKNIDLSEAKKTITFFEESQEKEASGETESPSAISDGNSSSSLTPSSANEEQPAFGTVIGQVKYTYGKREVGSADILYRASTAAKLQTAQAVDEVKDEKTVEEVVEAENSKPYWIIGVAAGVIVILIIGYLILTKRRQDSEFSFYKNRRRR